MRVCLKRDADKLTIELRPDAHPTGNMYYEFSVTYTGGESHARLLENHLINAFHEHMEGVRRTAYEQGWKDAKSKRRKQTNFYRCF